MTREEMDAAVASYRESGGNVTTCEPSKRGMNSRENRLTVRVSCYGGGAHRKMGPTHKGPKGITTATCVGLGKTVGNYNGIKYTESGSRSL